MISPTYEQYIFWIGFGIDQFNRYNCKSNDVGLMKTSREERCPREEADIVGLHSDSSPILPIPLHLLENVGVHELRCLS